MFELKVTSSSGNYPISISTTSSKIPIGGYFLADSKVTSHLDLISELGIFVEGSEKIKNLEFCEKTIIEMNDLGINRSDSLIAIGGGTVQDLATLATSLYMRGIKWIYYPTTFMAMVDSCIGGKSAINAKDRKNLIGNFYPPGSIQIHTKFIETLSQIDLINGLAEAVKICFARNNETFNHFLHLDSSLEPKNNDSTAELIYLTLQAKKWFVEIDEFDKAERQLLNFGHTFAHAIESATQYGIPHGTAVAMGMIAAISHRSSAQNSNTEKLHHYCNALLSLEKNLISSNFAKFSEEKFIESILRDKKNTKNDIRLILPANDSALSISSIEKNKDNLSYLVNIVTSVFEGV